MRDTQYDIAKEALAEHFDESDVTEVFTGAREFKVLVTLPREKYRPRQFLPDIRNSGINASKEDTQDTTGDVGGLERSVYKRSYSSLGVRKARVSFEPVTVERQVARELDDLQTDLPCNNKCDVIEYLLAYWASEGEVEVDYEFSQSEYILASHRISLLRPRNTDSNITKYW